MAPKLGYRIRLPAGRHRASAAAMARKSVAVLVRTGSRLSAMQGRDGDGKGVRRIRIAVPTAASSPWRRPAVRRSRSRRPILHLLGGNLGDIKAAGCALHHRDTARHAEFQSRSGRAGDKNLFDGCAVGPVGLDHGSQPGRNFGKTVRIGCPGVRLDDAVGDMDKTGPVERDHTPAGVADAWINAEYAHPPPSGRPAWP